MTVSWNFTNKFFFRITKQEFSEHINLKTCQCHYVVILNNVMRFYISIYNELPVTQWRITQSKVIRIFYSRNQGPKFVLFIWSRVATLFVYNNIYFQNFCTLLLVQNLVHNIQFVLNRDFRFPIICKGVINPYYFPESHCFPIPNYSYSTPYFLCNCSTDIFKN